MTVLTKSAIRAHLKNNWKTKGDCDVCGSNEWEVVDHEFALPSVTKEPAFSIAVVYCGKCGNTIFLAADVIRKALKDSLLPPQ